MIRWTGLLPPVCCPLPPRSSNVLPLLWSAEPDQAGRNSGSSGLNAPAVWLDSKRSSACFSHHAAALCFLRIQQQNCHLLCCTRLCLFEKAATVSLVVVQQWVCVLSVCVLVDAGFCISTHVTQFPVLLKLIPPFFFFFSCSLQPKPGFYHKAGQSNLQIMWRTLTVGAVSWHFEWQEIKRKEEVFSTLFSFIKHHCAWVKFTRIQTWSFPVCIETHLTEYWFVRLLHIELLQLSVPNFAFYLLLFTSVPGIRI